MSETSCNAFYHKLISKLYAHASLSSSHASLGRSLENTTRRLQPKPPVCGLDVPLDVVVTRNAAVETMHHVHPRVRNCSKVLHVYASCLPFLQPRELQYDDMYHYKRTASIRCLHPEQQIQSDIILSTTPCKDKTNEGLSV